MCPLKRSTERGIHFRPRFMEPSIACCEHCDPISTERKPVSLLRAGSTVGRSNIKCARRVYRYPADRLRTIPSAFEAKYRAIGISAKCGQVHISYKGIADFMEAVCPIAATTPLSDRGLKREGLIARAVDWVFGYDFFISYSHGDGM